MRVFKDEAMKIVTLSITVTCSDEFYESDMKKVVNDVRSGKLQREMKRDSKAGLKKVTATVQTA